MRDPDWRRNIHLAAAERYRDAGRNELDPCAFVHRRRWRWPWPIPVMLALALTLAAVVISRCAP